ncbi:hypothetical protein L1887_14880 [Cichorium endivia]|nr:hypothetical protein L1887_14880 [Cichorium endivia]
MAHRVAIQGLVLKGLWRTSANCTSFWLFPSRQKFQTPISSSRGDCKIITNIRDFCSQRRIDRQVNCSCNENISSSPPVVTENIQKAPQEADLQTISDGSQIDGRIGQTTNMVFGDTVIDGSTGEWLTLTQKMDTYPSVRKFTAIGIGGKDFVQSMVVAVESVIQNPVPQEHVRQRVSSGGKYVSVNIGPIHVVSREQVRAVYSAMRSDDRMKFFL